MVYEKEALQETMIWFKKLQKKENILKRVSKTAQTSIQKLIPEKVHVMMTDSIKQMVEVTLTTNEYIPSKQFNPTLPLKEMETIVFERQKYFQRLAAVEGAGTGAGGIFLGMADFPLLLAIKMRFLFEIGSIYGFQTKNYDERLFILNIFQLAFSSEAQKESLVERIKGWDEKEQHREQIDWRIWQQDYRDYIDLVKLFQLVPGIGAAVGAVANYQLLTHLGETAKHCYRIRLLKSQPE
ncbi:EcsC family protein [Bacillus salitolerans]|uniref:EcsC family protein n=1 Tax=Bacillus salitolerans TaxID=1437434 RepID=A0ABW4LW54_9BACI